MTTRKKHFGEPVHKKPVSFGNHYKSNNHHQESNLENIERSDFMVNSQDPVLIEQRHRHLLEKRALRNGVIANIFGILCWLLFCLSLLYFAFAQIDKDIYVAITVPVAGFLMLCWLAYIKKADISKRHNNKFRNSNHHHSGRNFRKSYKQK